MKQVKKEELAREELKRLRERIVHALFESKSRTPDELLQEIRDVAEAYEYVETRKKLTEAMKTVKVTPGEPVHFKMGEGDGDKTGNRGRDR